ncbi:hypothetical protein [Amycolatopsis arida]|uniref:hypothetical protein n=1 Tax=Amycolatopsis arida TaxID=587909 RepID=UPI000B88FB8F|nr:hypothetical protein [Amycolatopsis arida]
MDLVFQLGESLSELVAFGAQLGPAFVDVPDEVLVDVIGEFEAADQPLALGLVLADGSAHRSDPVGAFALGGLVQDLQVGVQELVSVLAEDLGGQEAGHPVDERVFADPDAGRVSAGSVRLLRRAHHVAVALGGLAREATTALDAPHVAAKAVDPRRARMLVRPASRSRPFALLGDLLGLHEGFQIDEGFVHRFG